MFMDDEMQQPMDGGAPMSDAPMGDDTAMPAGEEKEEGMGGEHASM